MVISHYPASKTGHESLVPEYGCSQYKNLVNSRPFKNHSPLIVLPYEDMFENNFHEISCIVRIDHTQCCLAKNV